MKKRVFFQISLLFWAAAVHGQDYLTIGGGFSFAFYESESLKNFAVTYNEVNYGTLRQGFEGLKGGEGIRWEIGYRRFDRTTAAAIFGRQLYTRHDFASFTNGEERGLELKIESLFLEGELGRSFKQFFVNGCLALHIHRRIQLDSEYSGLGGIEAKKPLTGLYESDTVFSTDIGLALGFYKRPVFLIVRIMYPVFTDGKFEVLRDRSTEKRENMTSVFPRDYQEYFDLGNYEGVPCNIDGLKLTMTFAFAIRLPRW